MKTFFHAPNKPGAYFEGWYFKCQTKSGEAIALIPAFHMDKEKSASIQVISDSGTWWIPYPESDFHAATHRLEVQIGDNRFSETGISLNIRRKDISLSGKLSFGALQPLQSDIMGPFRFLPNMECVHGVLSMRHPLWGQLVLNDTVLDFTDGIGYIETDRGRSFPSAYLWSQCVWKSGSILLSVATIPLSKFHFTGCICAIVYGGKEYRLATYRGARVEHWHGHGVRIRQGKYRLQAILLEPHAQPLRSPTNGAMERTIHESLQSKVRYRFWVGNQLLLDRTDCTAGFEFSSL